MDEIFIARTKSRKRYHLQLPRPDTSINTIIIDKDTTLKPNTNVGLTVAVQSSAGVSSGCPVAPWGDRRALPLLGACLGGIETLTNTKRLQETPLYCNGLELVPRPYAVRRREYSNALAFWNIALPPIWRLNNIKPTKCSWYKSTKIPKILPIIPFPKNVVSNFKYKE